jgi:hypothetical protein
MPAHHLKQAPISIFLLASVAIFAFTSRISPTFYSDDGIYASVGARLLRGDRLYVDVFDNKDPLFYYAWAALIGIGPGGHYLLNCSCFALLAWSGSLISKFGSPEGNFPRALSATLAALSLSGAWYSDSFLYGSVLLFLAVIFVVYKKFLPAGLALSAIFFTKITLFPAAAVIVFGYLLLELRSRRSGRSHLARVLLGLVVGALSILAVMAWRGEIMGYARVMSDNFLYAQGGINKSEGLAGSLMFHLLNTILFGWPVLLLICGCATAIYVLREDFFENTPQRSALVAAFVAVATSMAVASVTLMWASHVMVIAVPFVVVLPLTLPKLWRHRRIVGLSAWLACCLALISWTGSNRPVANPLHLAKRIEAQTQQSTEARDLIAVAGPGRHSYARIGTNDDTGHAVTLRDFSLHCAYFHQYPFTPPGRLYELLECAKQADYLIVHLRAGSYASPDLPWMPRGADFDRLDRTWFKYEHDVETLLSAHFECVRRSPEIRICKNRRGN